MIYNLNKMTDSQIKGEIVYSSQFIQEGMAELEKRRTSKSRELKSLIK